MKTIDVHAHCGVPAAMALMGLKLPTEALLMSSPAARLRAMDEQGIDMEALSINPYWYGAEHDLARRAHPPSRTRRSPRLCAAHLSASWPSRRVALQHPDLAAQQLEDGMRRYGLRSAAIGGSVERADLSDPRFHRLLGQGGVARRARLHPSAGHGGAERTARLKGNGLLTNTIGNPLETTIALSHLIFDGTLDRFPRLKICAAHGGGICPPTRRARTPSSPPSPTAARGSSRRSPPSI